MFLVSVWVSFGCTSPDPRGLFRESHRFGEAGSNGDGGQPTAGGSETFTDVSSSTEFQGQAAADDCSKIARVLMVRGRALGGGGQVVVRLEAADGNPLPGGFFAPCLELLDERTGTPLSFSIAHSQPEAVRTLVVVAPGQTETDALLMSILEQLFQALGASDRVALYSATNPTTQLLTFHQDPALLARKVVQAPRVADPDPGAVLTTAQAEFSLVGEGLNWLRRIIYLAPSLAAEGFAGAQQGEPMYAFVLGDGAEQDGDLRTIAAGGGAFEVLKSQVEAARNGGFINLGFCDPAVAFPARLVVRVSGRENAPQAVIPVEGPPPEDTNRPCDPNTVASEWPALTDRVEFVMDVNQRQIHDALVSADAKDDFELAIRPTPAADLIKADAHLRGDTSLTCARRSYTVDLAEGIHRYTIPGLGTDEFQLISMCLDPFYIQQNTANLLMERLGLTVLGSKVVELVIDGVSQGAYLLLEKYKERLLGDHGRVRSVLRREMDRAREVPSVKYPAEDDPAALADYQNFRNALGALSGETLEAQLRSRLDLDQFLKWLALMTVLQNGDYSDEVIFFGTETLGLNNQPTTFFQLNGWDSDDIFVPCHFEGAYAMSDANGLLYCVEGELEHRILGDPRIYALYVAALDGVLGVITDEVFREVAQQAAADVLKVLESDPARNAMTEMLTDHPEATSYAVAEQLILGHAETLLQRYSQRRSQLAAGIQTYRSAN